PGALYIFHAGADVHRGLVLGSRRFKVCRELRESVQRQINLAACAFDAEAADGRQEVAVQVLRLDQLQESKLGVEIGCQAAGLDLLAVLQDHAVSASAADQDL